MQHDPLHKAVIFHLHVDTMTQGNNLFSKIQHQFIQVHLNETQRATFTKKSYQGKPIVASSQSLVAALYPASGMGLLSLDE
jgi:hypothetical protein